MGIVPRIALAHVSDLIDGNDPLRSILRILARRPRRLVAALLAFSVKEVPLWFLPVITAAIIDIVAADGDVRDVARWFALAALLLLQNYPNHLIYRRNFMTVVRDTGAGLRQAPDLELNAGRAEVADVAGDIRFEGVSHRYPDADVDAIDDLSLHVPAGQTVAFVGSSGSGKSTLLNLVLGFVRPTRGRILLDGRDMQGLDLRTVRRFVSVVPQESVLFEGSIRDNVAYGLRDVDDARIEQALRDANAWEFVCSQPHGWDTRVGERGARLSGGQRQRLAIARALVRDPRILLLDEATSALDPSSEQLVKEALDRLMHGRTTFVVAHRLSTVRQAHRIVVLEGGRMVEHGTHDELLARAGRYAQLVELQGPTKG